MKILLTGASGFIGGHCLSSFGRNNVEIYPRNGCFEIKEVDSIIHCAGISDDKIVKGDTELLYKVNTELTIDLFDKFLHSNANVFIFLSSVKAVSEHTSLLMNELDAMNPLTHYGKSKLLAEKYILSKVIPEGKRVYILRLPVVYGPGNKGNLRALYKFASKGIPWPLGAFENMRSFCSIENLIFVMKELVDRSDIESGIYNICDESPISTNAIVSLMFKIKGRKPRILKLSKLYILTLAKIGDFFGLAFNSEVLLKLTSTYIVDNTKISRALKKSLPISTEKGLLNTLISFDHG